MTVRFWLAAGVTDLRKGFAALSALVEAVEWSGGLHVPDAAEKGRFVWLSAK